MSLIQTAIGLLISAVLTAAAIVGGSALIHSGKVTAIKNEITAIEQKSVEYANITGSYAGLSCTGLQGQNLEPANGCTGESFTSALAEGALTVAPSSTNAGFSITFTPTDSSLRVTDCAGPLSGSLKATLTSYSCGGSWVFTYGN